MQNPPPHLVFLAYLADGQGSRFEATLRRELHKVGAFYAAREEQLAAALEEAFQGSGSQGYDNLGAISRLKSELQDLRKYVVLNYVAVVKAVKKRNRHLAALSQSQVSSIRAVRILAGEYFFTSLRLAQLVTRVEIAARELSQAKLSQGFSLSNSSDEEEFKCPICLDLLRSPVVLSCAHRACWGCLVAYCTAVSNATETETQQSSMGLTSQQTIENDGKEKRPLQFSDMITDSMEIDSHADDGNYSVLKPAVWEGEASDDESVTVATFACPCCRKDQLMDLDHLVVDPHLDAYVRRLAESSISPREEKMQVDAIIAQSATAAVEISQHQHRKGEYTPSSPFSEPSLLVKAVEITVEKEKDQSKAAMAEGMAGEAESGEVPLLPPLAPHYQGRLTVCLDLDGTLVTTFTPKRAPSLPPSAVSYIVGKGGRLNPGGVFVVERPGLGAFLRRLRCFAEIVIFTAGLEDYAAPICDEIERRYGRFDYRLYRPATVHSDVYPCIKDLSRLGRDLRRCVLVDDTPLAFFKQPDLGIPVLQFRGDPDDRLLNEAVVPLLESLIHVPDVSRPLARRFNMLRWFEAQGLTVQSVSPSKTQITPGMTRAPSAPILPTSAELAAKSTGSKKQRAYDMPGPKDQVLDGEVLLVCDFDKTLLDCDSAERLCDEVAPELTSLLSQIESPANFIPVTNTVLAEMHRRGVSRDRIVAALHGIAGELPDGTVQLLQWAKQQRIDVRILSDANTVFISHILAAAKVHSFVREVVSNNAAFQRVEGVAASALGPESLMLKDSTEDCDDLTRHSGSKDGNKEAPNSGWFFGRRQGGVQNQQASTATNAPQYRLVVNPRHDYRKHGSHGCPLCPENLCKGRELDAMRAAVPRRRVVYAGDGANDLCPALCLGAEDVVLARAGYPLEKLIRERAAGAVDGRRIVAQVRVWRTHEELAQLVQETAV